MNTILKINKGISYQTYKNLNDDYGKDENMIKIIIKYLISYYYDYDYDMTILNFKYIYILFFVALPTSFIEKNNLYYGNRVLPVFYKNTIPFTLPIIYNKSIELNISNLYYYEVTLLEELETLILYIENPNIDTLNNIIHDASTYQVGDTVGLGIIYVDIYKYKPIYTLNGKLIKEGEEINIYTLLTPIIKCNNIHKIKVNLNSDEFKFDIKKYLNNNITFCTQNYFLDKINEEPEQIINYNIIDLILYIIK